MHHSYLRTKAEVALVAEASPSFRHLRHFRHLYISSPEKGVFLPKCLRMCIFCCTFAPEMVVHIPPNKVFFTH